MKWEHQGVIHENCCVVFRTKEDWGELSNMASGYPLRVNGEQIGSSEGLYQALRFPHEPTWQKEIIEQTNPMTSKMKAKKDGRRDQHSRPDWYEVQLDVMRWVLRVKLAQHPVMSGSLKRSGERKIVEKSARDTFWGAVEGEDGVLRGQNHLGLLLMEVRELVLTRSRAELEIVEPLAIADFLLLGKPIQPIKPR